MFLEAQVCVMCIPQTIQELIVLFCEVCQFSTFWIEQWCIAHAVFSLSVLTVHHNHCVACVLFCDKCCDKSLLMFVFDFWLSTCSFTHAYSLFILSKSNCQLLACVSLYVRAFFARSGLNFLHSLLRDSKPWAALPLSTSDNSALVATVAFLYLIPKQWL